MSIADPHAAGADPTLAETSRRDWTIDEAAELYGVPHWSEGYFRVGENGSMLVTPFQDPERSIDLRQLVEDLRERDLNAPVLIRFSDILDNRLRTIHSSFQKAIEDHKYTGRHHYVYPIKVNQQKHVVEEIRDFGAKLGFGFEAGSKPELLAVLGLTAESNPNTLIVCNGFKDDEFIETVVLATKLGRRIITVVEKFSELELLIKHAKAYGVKPMIGIRVKLAFRGAGRWQSSAGARSKFGLFLSEVLEALDLLKREGMEDCLQMVHCHIGSQVCDIRAIKNAVSELAHVYTELARLGAGMKYIDVGGGMAVDYDGSQSATESSMNYSIDEYASDVVYRIMSVCDEADVPHPDIVAECGRAMVAYSSVLVFEVTGVSRFEREPTEEEFEKVVQGEPETPQPLLDLRAASSAVGEENLGEVHHDALQAREELMSLFSLGYVSLPARALGESLFWSIGRKIMTTAAAVRARGEYVPEELDELEELLSDLYFCNLSIFQSIPDSWAIDQLFPICPIQRLDEKPTTRAVLADITCDSDGKIDRFAHPDGVRSTLPVHSLRNDEPYYLAAFLVGAYQEILGDLHNLFGDTHAAHVYLDEQGEIVVDEIIRGDSVAECLSYVAIDAAELRRAMRKEVEAGLRRKTLTLPESQALMRFYADGLQGYTYLE